MNEICKNMKLFTTIFSLMIGREPNGTCSADAIWRVGGGGKATLQKLNLTLTLECFNWGSKHEGRRVIKILSLAF